MADKLQQILNRYIDEGRRFMLLSAGRSGSTMLGTMLNTHPRLCCVGELFGVTANSPKQHNMTLRQRMASAWGNRNRGFSHTFPQPTEQYPLMPQLLDVKIPYLPPEQTGYPASLEVQALVDRFIWPIMQKLYDEGALRIILLERKNALAWYVSREYAAANQVWHDRGPREAAALAKAKPITLKPEDVERGIEYVCTRIRRLRETFPQALHICYEDLANNTADSVDKVLRFLDVPAAQMRTSTRKIATPWHKRVVNYAELKEHFKERPDIAQYFTEDE